MDVRQFYRALLKLPAPWDVHKVVLSDDGSRVDVWIVEAAGMEMPCPVCAIPRSIYDHTAERMWRHLDTCGSTTYIHARLPRIKCDDHGVLQVLAPFAESGARFTARMEKHCIDILSECSRQGASRLAAISWDEADGIMTRAVDRGMERRGEHIPKNMGLDEKAVFKRHKYCTIISDLDEGFVVDVLDGRKINLIEPWFEARREALANVENVAIDMSAGYANIVTGAIPGASINFDHFHVTQVVNKAVDATRKAEQQALDDENRQSFFRSRNLFLYNEENIPEHRRQQFEEARRVSSKTARAWAIKENFREIWSCGSLEDATDFFKKWYWWATHSRIEPIRKAAKTIKKHWEGVANAIVNNITNACTEGLNSKIEKIKRDAFGFRSRVKLRTAILFHCGKLKLYPEMCYSN